MSENLLSLALERIVNTLAISRDAALSTAWSYPLLGVTYFLSHPSIYRAVAPTIIKALTTSAGITAGMLFFTYLPQVAFCALFSGPFAFATAGLLVLSESAVLSMFVSKTFFLGAAQDRIFDAVLLQQGHGKLVEEGREVRTSSGFAKLGRSVTKPLERFGKEGLVRYLVSLPLNSIPGVGTGLFLVYNGIRAGPAYHARYFQLKRMDMQERKLFVEHRRGAYTAFGASALALNLVPFVGLVFGITSTVGAALWASRLEQTGASAGGSERKSAQNVHAVREVDEVQVEL